MGAVPSSPLPSMQLSHTLRVNRNLAPHVMAWLSRHGPLTSVVLAQLAETGVRASPAPVKLQWGSGTTDPAVDWDGAAGNTARLRLRSSLHPLAHPHLIAQLHQTPPELHRRLLIEAIESGIKIASGVRPEAVTMGPPIVDSASSGPVVADLTPAPSPTQAGRTPEQTTNVPTAGPHVAPEPTSQIAQPAPASDQSALLDIGSIATLFPQTYPD
jgi:hypothetical protein